MSVRRSPWSLEVPLTWVILFPRNGFTTLNLSTGFTNSSLYTGEIEYIDLATTESYWILPLACKYILSYLKLMSQGSYALQLLRCKVHRLQFRQDLLHLPLLTLEQLSLVAQAASSPRYMPRSQAPKLAQGTSKAIIRTVRNFAVRLSGLYSNRRIS